MKETKIEAAEATKAHRDDRSDLPPELLAQLKKPRADRYSEQIVEVIRDAGGTADMDSILIGLYRKFGEVRTRSSVQGKIARTDAIASVKGRMGVYSA